MIYRKSKMMVLSSNLTSTNNIFNELKKDLFDNLSTEESLMFLEDFKADELTKVFSNLKKYFYFKGQIQLINNASNVGYKSVVNNPASRTGILSGPNNISGLDLDDLLITGKNPSDILSEQDAKSFNLVNDKSLFKNKLQPLLSIPEGNFSLSEPDLGHSLDTKLNMYSLSYNIFFRNFLTNEQRRNIFVSDSNFDLTNQFDYSAGKDFGSYLLDAINSQNERKSKYSSHGLRDLVMFSGLQDSLGSKFPHEVDDFTNLLKNYLTGLRDHLELSSEREIYLIIPNLKSINVGKLFGNNYLDQP